MTRIILMLSSIFLSSLVVGQAPKEVSSVDIYHDLEKLNVLGSVLYIAAHPDDENTRLISYLSNEAKVRTAYLSLTRGDGGQNRIGTEIWEELGVLRTQELLAARSIDGGQQFFTRANDFGYSKHPDETLTIWNKEEVMHDIIKVIREFRPDVIINRFDHRTPGRTHGHHTSSAMLSVEAFDIAGDETAYADRLQGLAPWQPERVFFNTSWWFYGSRAKFAEADKTNLFAVDAGVYYPLRGLSNTEIAAEARSQHKCQGFGSTGTRGTQNEYVELIKGSRPTSKDDPLSGIDLTWNRVAGGAPIGEQVDKILTDYDFRNPAASIPALLEVRKAISMIDDAHWKKIKLAEIDDIITDCAGIFIEVKTDQRFATRNDEVAIDIELINRSNASVSVSNIALSNGSKIDTTVQLLDNEKTILTSTIKVNANQSYSNPYWLDKKGSLGMYYVQDASIIGTPESEASYRVAFEVTVNGQTITLVRDLVYKTNDAVKGAVYAPFYIVPEVSLAFADPIYLFSDQASKEIKLDLKSFADDVNGELTFNVASNWIISPASIPLQFKNAGETQQITVSITPPADASSATLDAIATIQGVDGAATQQVVQIEYEHIPNQIVLQPATTKLEKLNIKKAGNNIAYIQGAGDNIPKSLRQIGYDVDEIAINEISIEKIENYDAVVVGIRAYNTKKEIILKNDILNKYMTNGGTVIVQYVTHRGTKGEDVAPYPLQLSRDRVTDEYAEVTFLEPDHPVLNFPNKITSTDFDGWVQERGLYFPSEWDTDNYVTPLACNDKGEDPKKSGLMIAKVGKGYWIYTGYSWFRQLPAGVPGAFRIYSNMLSIGKADDNG